MIAFLCLASFLNLHAKEEVTIHLTSWHSIEKHNDGWNPYNYGFSYKNVDGIKGGAFYNSNYKTTIYLGYEQNLNPYCGYLIATGTGYDLPIGVALWCNYKNLRIDFLPISAQKQKYGVAIGFSLVF